MREISPWFGLTDGPDADLAVVVVGCPFGSADAFRGGADQGPAAIRAWARTAEAIDESGGAIRGLRVIDRGDAMVPGDGGEERWRAIEAMATAALAEHPGALLLGLGGDHAVTPPLATAARRAGEPPAFLLLDAHADCFAEYEGDPLSHACVLPRLWDRGGYAAADTCIAGVRSFASDELDRIDAAALAVSARTWRELGAEALAAEIRRASDGRPLYISVDIDVLDPSCAPGTGYPVPAGPDTRELLALLRAVFGGQPVVAMDVVEVAPPIDPSGITAATAAHIVLQALGFWAASRS